MREPFSIGGLEVAAGQRQLVDLPISKLSNHAPVTLPVHVLHGAGPGPTMFVSAAVHGDELNGVEIIRRLLRSLGPARISGTLLFVPVVNVFGFISRSRYLPDRRDLNRSFPGSATGSLAARLAHLFLTEIVTRSEIGLDLHTAAIHRINLPQIRCVFRDRPRCHELGIAFGTEVMLESPERPGSLREAARAVGVDVLSYEGGEGLRFDEFAIRAGVAGVAGVMAQIGMLSAADAVELVGSERRKPVLINASSWVRSPEGGVFRTAKRIGDQVDEGEVVGHVANPYEDIAVEVTSSRRGIIIGRTTLPIVNMGDALLNVGWSEDAEGSASPERGVPDEPPLDEDELLD